MKILSLDLSTKASGWAVFEDGILTKSGTIEKQKYPGFSSDRYPKQSALLGAKMADAVEILVDEVLPDKIIIEEASIQGKMGVKSVKGLIQLHGMILDRIQEYLDDVVMLAPSGKNGWRVVLGLKKNGDWKASAVKMANELHGLELTDDKHDEADAILIGKAFVELGE